MNTKDVDRTYSLLCTKQQINPKSVNTNSLWMTIRER